MHSLLSKNGLRLARPPQGPLCPIQWPDIRAAETRTRDLTVEVTTPMRRTNQFAKALERDIALSDQSLAEMCEMLVIMRFHLLTLTGHFTGVCERFPEAAKGIGENYPNTPCE